jgi:hypothetical protein
MKVWALSDPHLSFANAKPMHIFGEQWRDHGEKIAAAWRGRVAPQDIVLVPGDISWSRKLSNALTDLRWLADLPGRRKLIVRGNHDHWWPSGAREAGTLPAGLTLLEGSALELGDVVFCGTGGWLSPADPYFEALDRAAYERELSALQRALDAAAALERGRGIHLLLHFSPYTSDGQPTAFDRLLRRYPVRTVTFGHFHLPEEWERVPKGWVDGVYYALASADFIGFQPVELPL